MEYIARYAQTQNAKGTAMRNLFSGVGIACCSLILGVAAASPARAQGSGQTPAPAPAQTQQQGDQQKPAPGGAQTPPAEAPKVNPQEEADYKAFSALKADDVADQIKLGEDFVQKYPQSKYNEPVYAKLTQAYYAKQDIPKMNAAGEKALALNADDVSVLVQLGFVAPHFADPNDMDSERKLQKAEQELKHALDLLATMPKPATTLSDEDFAKAKAAATEQAHSGLGLVYFREGKYDESLAEFKISTAGQSPDPTDLYVMGVDLQQLKRFGEAADAYGKCASISGQLQPRCKQRADQMKQQAAAAPAAKP
jgi:tetratricopeptide (TPR) repeat protein